MSGEDHCVLGAGMGQVAAVGIRDGITDCKGSSGSSWETDSEEMLRVWHSRWGRTSEVSGRGDCAV